jgi:hypothetical protein
MTIGFAPGMIWSIFVSVSSAAISHLRFHQRRERICPISARIAARIRLWLATEQTMAPHFIVIVSKAPMANDKVK